jgi:hypothetical protein
MIVAFSEIPKVDLLWHMGCCYLLASDKVRSEPLQKKEMFGEHAAEVLRTDRKL